MLPEMLAIVAASIFVTYVLVKLENNLKTKQDCECELKVSIDWQTPDGVPAVRIATSKDYEKTRRGPVLRVFVDDKLVHANPDWNKL